MSYRKEPPLLTEWEAEDTMDQSMCSLELLGVFFSVLAWVCSLASTLMPSWLNLNSDLLPSENFYLGLWGTCVMQDMGDGQECRFYDSMLALPQDIQLARTLMCLALAVGVLGLLLTIPGLHLVKSCHSQVEDLRCKRGLKMSGGVLWLVAGVLVLIPVSHIAHNTVKQFFDEALPDILERWEFGEALFCGWAAGLLYLLAGTLLLTSCVRLQKQNCDTPVPILMMGEPSGVPFIWSRSEYV